MLDAEKLNSKQLTVRTELKPAKMAHKSRRTLEFFRLLAFALISGTILSFWLGNLIPHLLVYIAFVVPICYIAQTIVRCRRVFRNSQENNTGCPAS